MSRRTRPLARLGTASAFAIALTLLPAAAHGAGEEVTDPAGDATPAAICAASNTGMNATRR